MIDTLLDDAPCGFLVFKDNGCITMANRTLEAMLGYGRGGLPGKKLEQLLSIAGRIFLQTHLFPLISLHGKAEEIFLTLRANEGPDVPVLLNAKRKETAEGFENHCVLMPVHQRKKYESELLQARKEAEDAAGRNEQLVLAKEELETHRMELDRKLSRLLVMNEDLFKFGKVISHDMQEPARKVAVFADMILRDAGSVLSENTRTTLDRILSASRRMRSLIHCLQEYVGIDTMAGDTAPCKLEAVIAAAKQKAERNFADVAIELEHPALPLVEGHCDQLELLFYQLIINAVQFRKEGGAAARIRVECDLIQQNSYRALPGKYRYVDFARIVFKDEGKGFRGELAAYVFQLFKKAHDDAPGLGFGLALCRKIVANHYGDISARSEPGLGAAFTILLPVEMGKD